MYKHKTIALLALAALLPACSNDTSDAQVLKSQAASSIQKAEDVNALIESTADKQRQAIDQQSQ